MTADETARPNSRICQLSRPIGFSLQAVVGPQGHALLQIDANIVCGLKVDRSKLQRITHSVVRAEADKAIARGTPRASAAFAVSRA